MLELGVFHNGASDLPKKITSDGVVVNDGTLADSHQSFQRVVTAQVRQGVLADPEPTSRLKRNVEIYYEELEKQGWPDRLNRGKFKFGWDAEKRRGFAPCRNIHIVMPGMDRDKQWQRVKMGMELEWDYYGPFGFAAVLAEADEPMYDMSMKVTAELLAQKEVLIFGTADSSGQRNELCEAL
jgi:hypothetical protein